MTYHRCDDWKELGGVYVEIHKRGRLIRAGVVDAAMPDSTILWLASDFHGSRALFELAEGFEVWTDLNDVQEELPSHDLPADQKL